MKKLTVSLALLLLSMVAGAQNDGAAVMPFGDTLFVVYGNIGGISAQHRAKFIAENIVSLREDMLYSADSVRVVEENGSYNIVYGSNVIAGVTDYQGRVAGKSTHALAQSYRNTIVAAIAKARAVTWRSVLLQVLLAALILAAVYFGVKYLAVFNRKLEIFLMRRKFKLRSIKPINFLLDANKQLSIVLWAIKILRWVLTLLLLYICLMLLFRLLPSTRWISDILVGYIVSPLKRAALSLWYFLPSLFAIIVIITLFRLLVKALHIIADKIENGSIAITNFSPLWAKPTYQIIRVIVYVFMFIFIYPYLPNSDSDAFKGVSVFMGVLFSLGSTSIISNIVSGLVITYMSPFKDGDRIKMGEYVGDVVEKTALVTRLRTSKNEVITIPNSNIMTAQTINYTKSAAEYGLILHANVTMGYDVPWRKVHELLIEAGLASQGVSSEPRPFVLQTALDDFYVQYQINVYTTDASRMPATYSNLFANIQDVFDREGIELMSPHVSAVRDGSAAAMPPDYVRKGQEHTPPIKVAVEKPKNFSA